MENRAFKIAGIKNLIKNNYAVATDIIDLNAEVDDRLTMAENWRLIKEKIIILCEKKNKVMFS
jgi:hypothetical protein